ncbi:MAG TPA: SWIM zinc finger family protein [Longimicrobium sp.]|nr:SWIM zinc finger family protein [Longimicrobium sp.]
MTVWTPDQVAALAPDAGAAKAGQALASPAKWGALGRDARALWGECQGSGSKPYQTAVDEAGPGFRCTCPSRKFPCKHALGLLFLHAGRPGAVPEGAPPPWVAEWIAGREARAEKKAAPPSGEPAKAPDPEAQAKRAARRDERVAAGVEEAARWMEDVVRQGFGTLASRPRGFWETVAARLVDAQAPGAARRVREMAPLPHSGDGWPDRLLERLGRLHLLAEAFRRLDALPGPAQDEVRAALGWTVRQEEVAAAEGVRDRWAVLGQRVEEEDRLLVRRTWLRGEETGRGALLLAFAAARQPLEPGPPPGRVLDAELAFYPAAFPLRATIRARHGEPRPLAALGGHASVTEAAAAWADALARNPWIERIGVPLTGVVPVRHGGDWLLRDAVGAGLPVAPSASEAGWPLLALSGGRPVDVFGEWDGDGLVPLSVVAEGRFLPLAPSRAGAAA